MGLTLSFFGFLPRFSFVMAWKASWNSTEASVSCTVARMMSLVAICHRNLGLWPFFLWFFWIV